MGSSVIMREERRKRWIAFLVMLLVLLIMLFPFAWMISTSIKTSQEIYVRPPVWMPKSPTFENYQHVFNSTQFPRHFLNSAIVGIGTTCVALCIAITSAYSLSRLRFRGRQIYGVWLLYTQVLPHVFMLLPLFLLMSRLGLLNSYWSLIITYSTICLPFSIWMLKGYFDTTPPDLEDAARIDGCTRIQAMWRIVIPPSIPGIAAVAIYVFIVAWQEFLFALTLTRTESMRTVTVSLSMLRGDIRVLWGPIMAASVLTVLPVAIAFVFVSKSLVQGLTMGAVKG